LIGIALTQPVCEFKDNDSLTLAIRNKTPSQILPMSAEGMFPLKAKTPADTERKRERGQCVFERLLWLAVLPQKK